MITERLITRDGALLYLRRGDPLTEPCHSRDRAAPTCRLDEVIWLLPGNGVTSPPAAASYVLLKSSVPWLQDAHLRRLHSNHRSHANRRETRETLEKTSESRWDERLEVQLFLFARHILCVRDALQLGQPPVSQWVDWDTTGVCVNKGCSWQVNLSTRHDCEELIVEIFPEEPRHMFPVCIYTHGTTRDASAPAQSAGSDG
jgi:hypothetical protein